MGGAIAVYNGCANTTKNMNGLVFNLHPGEGVWVFRGSMRGGCFGSMFGDVETCGMFPTSAPAVKRAESILVRDPQCVVRLGGTLQQQERYMCADEAFLSNLQKMQWCRDNGVVELIPIVVGLP